MRRRSHQLGILFALLAFVPAAHADSCTAQPLSAVLGTYCTIGELNFSFHNLETSNINEYGAQPGLTADQIQFTPIIAGPHQQGFRLDFYLHATSVLPDDLSIIPADSSPAPIITPSDQENYATLFFGVATIAPFTGIHQSDTASDATSSPTGGYSTAFAGDYSCNVAPECYWSYAGSEIGRYDLWSIYRPTQVFYSNFTHMSSWNLLYSYAELGSEATLTSATTLYTTIYDPYPVPEPSTIWLLTTGLLALPFSRRK